MLEVDAVLFDRIDLPLTRGQDANSLCDFPRIRNAPNLCSTQYCSDLSSKNEKMGHNAREET